MTTVADRVIPLDGSSIPDRDVVGNKGRSIARMMSLGLPVPPAFALPIEECRRFHAAGGRLDQDAWQSVREGVAALEERSGRRLGDERDPLLVSVRSAAAVSMPGMMDTILNLGMTDAVEARLAELSGDAEFARNTHIRFVHEFGRTVLGADLGDPAEYRSAEDARDAVLGDVGGEWPYAPLDQLRLAISAIFGSWSSRRAKAFRRHWEIPEDGGTAAIVQAMVFGNLGDRSGTGVLFTRNPLSGEAEAYGEWLPGGQGEDVVSGTFDPLALSALSDQLPDVHDQLLEAGRLLEREHREVQDIEFTVERGQLYLLQTRAAKRSPLAAVRTMVDLVAEGALARQEALRRISVEQVASVLAPRLPESLATAAEVAARGTPACPGVASGEAVGDVEGAEAHGGDAVLVRPTTSPEDIAGMIAARAVITERGGSTSHAAVVTRALGRPSVVGVGEGLTAALEGRELTVDGTAGIVYEGRLETVETDTAEVPGLDQILAWLEEISPIQVADSASEFLDLDAEGVQIEADGEPDVDDLASRLRGAPAARGSVLATPAGARAALLADLPTVVRLPGQPAAGLLLRFVQEMLNAKEEKP